MLGESLHETEAEREVADREIERLTGALVAMEADLVVPFGSRATGRALRGSDADLLTVMHGPPEESFPDRLARIWTHLAQRIPVDLLVYTPEEFARLRNRPFLRDALAQGRVLHRAP
jgi:uncharacterized protein